jgi:hypothetical protein
MTQVITRKPHRVLLRETRTLILAVVIGTVLVAEVAVLALTSVVRGTRVRYRDHFFIHAALIDAFE